MNKKEFYKDLEGLKKFRSESGLSLGRQEEIKKAIFGKLDMEDVAVEKPGAFIHLRRFFQGAVSVGLSLSVLAGTAFASAGSLPGDFLYPVKRVIEKAHVAVSISDQSKAEVQAKHVEKRLAEYEKIKSEEDHEVELENKVRTSTEDDVRNTIENLNRVKLQLEEKGNQNAADAISENISRIETKAREAEVLEDEKQDTEDEDKAEKVEGAETERGNSRKEDSSRQNVETPSRETDTEKNPQKSEDDQKDRSELSR